MLRDLAPAYVEVWIDGTKRTDVMLRNVAAFANGSPEVAEFEYRLKGNNPTPSLLDGVGASEEDRVSLEIENKLVQIRIKDEWVHYGRAVATQIESGPNGQSQVFKSRLDPWMFGDDLFDVPCPSDPFNSGRIIVRGKDIILNPTADGVAIGNLIPEDDASPNEHDITMPGLMKFEPKLGNANCEFIESELWDLRKATAFICNLLNGEETHVKNPEKENLDDIIVDETVIRNVRFRVGSYLPDILTKLLRPHGYGWIIEHESKTERRIKVYVRSGHESVEETGFDHSAPGGTFSDADELFQVQASNDLGGNAVSAIRVLGGIRQAEVTFELTPDWDAELQDEPYDYYQRDSDEWSTNPKLADVFRLWSLVPRQECGDDNLDVPENRAGIDATSFTTILGEEEPYFARRQFEPCITKGADGRPYGKFRGCHIEFSKDGGTTWFSIESARGKPSLAGGASAQVLNDQLSIRFTGELPPVEIMLAIDEDSDADDPPPNIRLRITATIRGISSASHLEEYDESPLEDRKVLTIDMGSSFPYRVNHNSVVFGRAGVNTEDFTDSSEEMQDFAEKTLEQQKHSKVAGTITTPRADFGRKDFLGFPVLDIQAIYMHFYSGTAYPVITGWSVDLQRQTTTFNIGSR